MPLWRPSASASTMDQRGISAGEDWQKRLGALIRDADTVAFVLSPSSARSEMCAWEVGEAVRLGKRILPVLCRSLEDAKAPEKLASLNYIFFYAEPRSDGSGFGSGLALLVKALNTDLDWLREHTRYLQRATEWDTGGRSASRLLSGPDIASAKAWAARRPKDAPEPTPLQLDFIKASETEEIRQQSAEAQRLQEISEAQAAREKALADREKAQQLEAEARKSEAEAQKREAEEARRVAQRTMAGLAAALVLAVVAGWFAWTANQQRDVALEATRTANHAARPGPIAGVCVRLRPSPSRRARRATSRRRCCSRWRPCRTRGLAANVRGRPRGRQPCIKRGCGTARRYWRGTVATSTPRRSALTTRMLSRRPTTRRRECGICAVSAQASSPSRGIRTASSPRRSAPTARMSLQHRPIGRRECGTCDRRRQHSSRSRGIMARSSRRRSAPMGHTWSRRRPTRRQGCGICVGSGRALSRSRGTAIWSISRHSAPTERMCLRRRWRIRQGCGICAGSGRALSRSRGISARSIPRHSAPTERMWSRRPATKRRGCGICAGSARALSHSRGTAMQSLPRHSAPMERMLLRRRPTRRRGCGIWGRSRRALSPSRGTRVESTPRRSALTARMWSRRRWMGRRGCGICVQSQPSFVALEGHRVESTPRRSALTAHMWSGVSGRDRACVGLAQGAAECRGARGTSGSGQSASFSADGTHVVTASSDKTARVWDLRAEPPSFVALEGHQFTVNSASFSADGAHVVTASADNTARVWYLRGEQPSFVALEASGSGHLRVVQRRRDACGHSV